MSNSGFCHVALSVCWLTHGGGGALRRRRSLVSGKKTQKSRKPLFGWSRTDNLIETAPDPTQTPQIPSRYPTDTSTDCPYHTLSSNCEGVDSRRLFFMIQGSVQSMFQAILSPGCCPFKSPVYWSCSVQPRMLSAVQVDA